jgi:hypothetical protein
VYEVLEDYLSGKLKPETEEQRKEEKSLAAKSNSRK